MPAVALLARRRAARLLLQLLLQHSSGLLQLLLRLLLPKLRLAHVRAVVRLLVLQLLHMRMLQLLLQLVLLSRSQKRHAAATALHLCSSRRVVAHLCKLLLRELRRRERRARASLRFTM